MSTRGRDLVPVFIGGAAGTGARLLLSAAFPADGALPVTLVINVTGAFLLGVLTAAVAVRTSGAAKQALTSLLGTGFLGGYTTYGTFAVDTDGLLTADHFASSVLYGMATVMLGFAAAAGGRMVGLLAAKNPQGVGPR